MVDISLGFWSILGLIIITLKLLKKINWPWKVILFPLYAPFLLAILAGFGFLIII
jgi:hypothetical protein